MGINRNVHALSRITLILFTAVFVSGCMSNLNWVDPADKVYDPPPTSTVTIEFGINDVVDQLPSGDLPITVQKTITNDGTKAITAGYNIVENVLGMNFIAAAGHAGYVPGDPATQTVFFCSQPGPALAPGDSATIQFVLGSPACPALIPPPPAPPITELPCGVYQETLTIDVPDVINETDENDNEDEHYFYVPSDVQTININTVRNPTGNPNVFVVGTTVKVVAFAFPPPPATPSILTHNYTTGVVPAGSAYRVNARSPRVSPISGTSCALTPAMPATAPPSPGGGFTCTIPDTSFVGPVCNSFLGNVPVFEENLNTKITAISADGCIIRQKTLQVAMIFECRN